MTKKKDPADILPSGRPTKYKPEYDDLAYKFCLLSAIDEDLARFFDVSEVTINTWKKAHPTFLESVKKGKHIADAQVAERLFRRAMGYEHPEVKVFYDKDADEGEKFATFNVTKHYPPDTGAAFIWLKNRAGWKDKQEKEHVHVLKEKIDFKTVCDRVMTRRADGDGIPTD